MTDYWQRNLLVYLLIIMKNSDRTSSIMSPSTRCDFDISPTKSFFRRFMAWLFSVVLLFVPSFANKPLILRTLYSLALAIFIGLIISVKCDTVHQAITDALFYDPVEHAQKLRDERRLFTAYEYLTFYESIPGVSISQEFKNLKTQIESERSTVGYIAQEFCKGLFLGESEETYGVSAEAITEMFAIGDIRALYGEAKHYANNEEVDHVNAILSGLGLTLSAAQAGPQRAIVGPFKSVITLLRKGAVLMSKPLRIGIRRIFQPLINNSEAISRGLKRGEIHPELSGVVAQCRSVFEGITALIQNNPRAALLVIRLTDDVRELNKNVLLTMHMGKDATQILTHGGKQALETAEQLQKNGRLDVYKLKQSMKYGRAGLEALKDFTIEQLEDMVRKQRILFSGKGLYYIKYAISRIPASLAFFAALYITLILHKTWFYTEKCNLKKLISFTSATH